MFVPPPEEDKAPAGIELMRFPIVEEVTVMVTEQDPGVGPL
jgi:hypothetical protein